MHASSLVRVAVGILACALFGVLRVNATSAGTVVVWGATDLAVTTVPANLSGVTAIAAGGRHCVALKSDGTVVAWGENAFGQTIVPAGLTGVKAVAAGDVNTAALKNDGTVVAWGDNSTGQTNVPAGLNGVTAIAVGSLGANIGGGFIVALKSDGTVVAWGTNIDRQATVPADLAGVTAISGSGSHILALKRDGGVVAWGRNYSGETDVPAGLGGVLAIAANGSHSVVLRSDGTVAAWGWNRDGQTNVPTNLDGVVAIAAGYSQTVALRGNGTVVAWGSNSDGQTTVPAGLTNVTAIAAGGRYCAALIGTADVVPNFTVQPLPVTVAAGSTVALGAAATSATSYQWRKDGVNIVGANGATLVIQNVAGAQAGSYSVVATNNAGSTSSNAATLSLANSANFGHLINLSIRTNLTAADPSFTLGTVIGGAAGTKPLLVRAVGPSLAQFGIANAISAAKLDVFAGSALVASNDGWGGSATMNNVFASVGAFALASGSSKDSAIFNPAIAARDYTVQVSGSGNATGEVLAELYDAATLTSFNALTPRLVNVSVRKTIATAETLTVGFVIAGDTARTVLVRAIGPGLAAFGVPGTMPDPQLALFSSEGKIAENDDWSGDAQLSALGSGIGAFAIADSRSKDAMILMTLPPGSYTAQVNAAGVGGQVLVEVYEVP